MLEGIIRESISKSINKALRNDGYLIANIYGKGAQNIHCAFKKNDFIRALKAKSGIIFQVNVDGKVLDVVVQEYQKDPVTSEILHVDLLLVDEAQFLTERQVYELVIITKQLDVPVICFGLKVDFQGKLFKGSDALLRYADSFEELTAICNCGKKARFNARKIDNEYTFDGEQVLIGADESYEPLCEKCFLEKVLIPHSKEFQKILTKE